MGMRLTTQQAVEQYYGHGKLLITGEYYVLDGAQALALPTKFGQGLRVTTLHSAENIMYWVALNNQGKPWLNLVFDTSTLTCINSQQPEAQRLSTILNAARKLNSNFLNNDKDLAVETHLEFPNQWGLGTSSTLIHCVASWAQVDGYALLKNTIGGSGYDVACAAAESAVLYRLVDGKPNVLHVNWHPVFSNQIYFAYTGQKQLSSEGIKHYKSITEDKTSTIDELNRITDLILNCTEINLFEQLINEHETIIARELKLLKVSNTIFADYWGSVKSLGAWGGDFVMLTNQGSEEELKAYLRQKNIDTVFNWNDLILSYNPVK